MTIRPVAQGDLLIFPVASIPVKAKLAKADGAHYVVGHSETGHHHVVLKERAEMYEVVDDAFVAWIKTLGPAEIEHQREFDTHAPIKLEPNKVYEVRRQREYSPEGWRRAAD